MPHVDVIGSHPNQLFTHLQAAGYTYTQNATYSTSILNVDQPPAAVIIRGGDVAVQSKEAILKLLRTDAILLLFTPSPALLQVVKSAIKTSVDLPKLDLPNNVPCIVHKIKGFDRFRLIPGFSQDDALVDPDNVSGLLEYSVKLIAESVSYALDPKIHRALAEDALLPPADMDFVNNTIVVVGTIPNSQWVLYIYTYATNVLPSDPQFKEKGGVVYTIIRHDGNTLNPTLSTAKNFTFGDETLLQGDSHQPERWSKEEGTTLYYDIKFSRVLNLFKDNGKTPVQHTVTYNDSYTLNWVKQTYTHPDVHKYGIKLQAWLADFPDRVMGIRGLSVWRSDVGKTTLNLSGPMGTKDVPLDLRFPLPEFLEMAEP